MLRALARRLRRSYNNCIRADRAERIIEGAEAILRALEEEQRKAGERRHDGAGDNKINFRVVIRQFALSKAQIRVAQRLNLITAVAAIFAFAAAGAVIWSVFDARDATVEANRAWLAAVNLGHGDVIKGQPIPIQLKIADTGREPALRAVWKFNVHAAKYIPLPSTGRPAPTEQRNSACDSLPLAPDNDGLALFPGTNAMIPYLTDKKEQHDVDAAVDRRVTLIVEGCLVYWGGGRRRTTAFRYLLRDTDTDQPSDWLFNADSTGNSAD